MTRQTILVLLLLAVALYVDAACFVFQWRHPTANRVTLLRELPAVLTWKKLERYQ